MHHLLRSTLSLALVIALLSSCTINRDIMFKTSTDHVFDNFSDSVSGQLLLQPNDMIQFRLFANDGFKMIDLVSEGGGRDAQFMNRNIFLYLIEFDGTMKLPLLGRVAVSGMTVREAEIMLEERYTQYYNRPFVQVTVNNRRVVVFPGRRRGCPHHSAGEQQYHSIGSAGLSRRHLTQGECLPCEALPPHARRRPQGVRVRPVHHRWAQTCRHRHAGG
jgi:hypothetical protein